MNPKINNSEILARLEKWKGVRTRDRIFEAMKGIEKVEKVLRVKTESMTPLEAQLCARELFKALYYLREAFP